jgi:hypothetical protein
MEALFRGHLSVQAEGKGTIEEDFDMIFPPILDLDSGYSPHSALTIT